MPKVAKQYHAADYELDPNGIAKMLSEFERNRCQS
jgi:hypothetical protein